MSGTDGQGFQIALSPDVQTKVEGALNGCQQADDKCYQDIMGVFYASDIDMDNQLDSRDFAQLLSKTFKKFSAMFLEITAVLIALWKQQKSGTQGFNPAINFIPESQASQVGSITDGGPLVVSGGGSAIFTVTLTQEPNTITA